MQVKKAQSFQASVPFICLLKTIPINTDTHQPSFLNDWYGLKTPNLKEKNRHDVAWQSSKSLRSTPWGFKWLADPVGDIPHYLSHPSLFLYHLDIHQYSAIMDTINHSKLALLYLRNRLINRSWNHRKLYFYRVISLWSFSLSSFSLFYKKSQTPQVTHLSSDCESYFFCSSMIFYQHDHGRLYPHRGSWELKRYLYCRHSICYLDSLFIKV